jgi:hypothetical protein
MTFKNWAAAGASCLAIAALAAASANPATAAKNRYAGMITLGYSFTDFDLQNGSNSDTNINTFIGSGAVMYNLEGNWFAQADFAFASHSPDINAGPINLSLDTWNAGGTVFWRDPGVGMFGVDLAYQSADIGISGDGYRAGVRGEWYPNDRWTVSGAIGWEQLDFNLATVDGVYANAAVKFYFTDKLSASLNANYFEGNVDLVNFNSQQWSVGAEGEYLISRDTPVSIYAGVRYGDFSVDNTPSGFDDPTQFTAYVGLKFRFGNDGDSLVGQDREGAVSPTTTGFGQPFQM